jgi:uncharacterized DUF497 family protein
MSDDDFEWGEQKARENLAKHNVDFSHARRVFDDPCAIDWLDDRQNYGEDGRLLHVAYTMPDDATIRIISARRARPNERRKYHESQT